VISMLYCCKYEGGGKMYFDRFETSKQFNF
jgi:hypothetical protein